MEFGIEKCSMLKMKNGKRETMEGIELLNQESNKMLGKKVNYKYLQILEAKLLADVMQQSEFK